MKARKIRLRSDWLPEDYRQLDLNEVTLKGDLIFTLQGKKWKHTDTTQSPGFHGETVQKNHAKGYYRFTRKITEKPK